MLAAESFLLHTKKKTDGKYFTLNLPACLREDYDIPKYVWNQNCDSTVRNLNCIICPD